jgi:hypothetical protein
MHVCMQARVHPALQNDFVTFIQSSIKRYTRVRIQGLCQAAAVRYACMFNNLMQALPRGEQLLAARIGGVHT